MCNKDWQTLSLSCALYMCPKCIGLFFLKHVHNYVINLKTNKTKLVRFIRKPKKKKKPVDLEKNTTWQLFLTLFKIAEASTFTELFSFCVYFCSCAIYRNICDLYAYSQIFAFSKVQLKIVPNYLLICQLKVTCKSDNKICWIPSFI